MFRASTLHLRLALVGNAIFSLSTGLATLVLPQRVAGWVGFESPFVLRLLGLGLLVFSALLLYTAGHPRARVRLALLASLGDFGWVLGTGMLHLATPDIFSAFGWGVAWAIAVVVLFWGVAQAHGILRLYRNPNPNRQGWRGYCVQVEVDAAPDDVWAVVRDVGRIHAYYAGLASSQLVDDAPAGCGLVRECADHAGRTWYEAINVLDEERQLHIRFLAERDDFPFPFRAMEGGWSVETVPAATRVRMWIEMQPKQVAMAWILLPLLSASFDRTFPDIVARMAYAAKHGCAPDKSAAQATAQPRLQLC